MVHKQHRVKLHNRTWSNSLIGLIDEHSISPHLQLGSAYLPLSLTRRVDTKHSKKGIMQAIYLLVIPIPWINELIVVADTPRYRSLANA